MRALVAFAMLVSVANAQNYSGTFTGDGSYRLNNDNFVSAGEEWSIDLTVDAENSQVTVHSFTGSYDTTHAINPRADIAIDFDASAAEQTLPLSLFGGTELRATGWDVSVGGTADYTTPFSFTQTDLNYSPVTTSLFLEFENFPSELGLRFGVSTDGQPKTVGPFQSLQIVNISQHPGVTLQQTAGSVATIPEPTTAILGLCAIACLVLLRRVGVAPVAAVALVLVAPGVSAAQRFTGTRDAHVLIRAAGEEYGHNPSVPNPDPMLPATWSVDVEILPSNELHVHEITLEVDPITVNPSGISEIQFDSIEFRWEDVTAPFIPDENETQAIFRTPSLKSMSGSAQGTSTLLGSVESFDVSLPASPTNNWGGMFFNLDNYGTSVDFFGWNSVQGARFVSEFSRDIGNGFRFFRVDVINVPDASHPVHQASFDLFDSGVADVDGDGDVDGLDFLDWQSGGDGSLGAWQNQYGSAGAGSAIASVPEPSAWLMAVAVVMLSVNGFRNPKSTGKGDAR